MDIDEMNTETVLDRNTCAGRNGKRRRSENSSSATPHGHDNLSPSGTDCYNEIIEGSNNDVNNSWLLNAHPVPATAKDSSSSPLLSREIKSLSQQLIQVKRRLWPAAEECTNVINERTHEHFETKTTPEQEFWNARDKANPMEILGEGRLGGLNRNMFINRSAIKLANLDAILGFKLTTTSASKPEPFLFADLCGAPGGFSEYLMKRCQLHQRHSSCRGYGMSLLGKNEHGKGTTWRLQNLSSRDGAYVTNYLVSTGADGTGDLYQWDNVTHFQNEITQDLVEAGLFPRKMDLVTADGGFDAQRDSECQEGLAQKLILCEFASGLELLRVGGTMIVKLFGCQTDSIRRAMRFLYKHFDRIQEIKPISSRPASQERYAVFTGFQGLPESWVGGPSWFSSILTGRLPQDLLACAEIDDYLDRIDRDMLVLNLKACFAILSDLERRIAAAVSAADDLKGRERKPSKKQRWYVKMYKHAWQLHGMEEYLGTEK